MVFIVCFSNLGCVTFEPATSVVGHNLCFLHRTHTDTSPLGLFTKTFTLNVFFLEL